MARKPTIAINGFGRIGRAILRTLMAKRERAFDVVLLNDIADADTCAYLLEFDSVYGQFPGTVARSKGFLVVDGYAIPLTHKADLSGLDLDGVDLVMDCTGKAGDRTFAEAGLRAGAGKVLISGPSKSADATVVRGANDHILADQKVISNASCTTNAVAPVLASLNTAFGVFAGHMTTIHCYTGSQPTVDAPRGGALERNRAAALSMVPTTTSAMALIDEVLPELTGRIKGCAVRVPTPSVSAVDLVVQLGRQCSARDVNEHLKTALPEILAHIDQPLVSQDLRARPESFILATPETTAMNGGMLRIFGWYDNEFGFANRMIDMAHRMISGRYAPSP